MSVDRTGFDRVIAENAGKVVLVDYWASWCPPCQYAFPHTVALYVENRERGLQVVSVSLDSAADARKPSGDASNDVVGPCQFTPRTKVPKAL